LSKIGKRVQLIPRPSEKLKEVRHMFILEYRDGKKPEELSPGVKANMERCANFLVQMIEKYGREVLEEIEAEERAAAEKSEQESSDTY
jgi:hypothetical protein